MKPNFIGILSVVLFIFFSFISAFTQPYYGFNFNKEWEWVEFIYGHYDVSETSKNLIEELEKTLDIRDARILFKNLSLLDSLNQVKELIYIAEQDSLIIPTDFKKKLESAFMYFDASNTLNGLIYTAYVLAPLQKYAPFNSKSYIEKKPFLNVFDTLSIDFKLSYTYSNAELIINLLEKKNIDYYKEIEESSPEYAKNLRLNREKINMCFEYATNNTPLYNIYKVLNPSSFSNLGGIYLYKEKISKAINKYKKDEELITFEIKNRVFQLLPYEVSINSKINFSLGLEVYDDYLSKLSKKETYMNVETFGEDYFKLIKYITRQLFLKGRNQIYTNILPYTVKGIDSVLVYILNEVHSGGVLNYIAPVLEENRPLSLLEKDFQFFKKVIKEIKYSKKEIIDSLINEGLTGFAMFYTMGTEITFTIDRLQGRQEIRNSLILGPIHFFDSYINVYKENEKIRSVFKFPSDFEEKIKSLKTLYAEDIAYEVVKLSLKQKIYENNPGEWRQILIEEAGKISYKYRNHYKSRLVYLYLADLLFKEDIFDESVKYFIKVIENSEEKVRTFANIYSLFEKKSQFEECKILCSEFLKHIPNCLPAYLLRGIANYKTYNYNEAKEDFENVLRFDPYNEDAIKYMNLIETESP